ncbi:GTPase IMAP family member 8-like [Aplochiton taeniatus]
MVKREIVHSVSLCPPGPHVFLIVIKTSSQFSEKRRRALEEHMALLTEKVWSHCLVVFTCRVWPQLTTAEQHVGKGGTTLQWLSEKCSQRCHVIAFNEKSAGAQVTDLLVKIQELVTKNRGRHFEMEERALQEIAEENTTIEERAQQRLMNVKKQISLHQEKVVNLSEISIVLLGARGSGKSSSGNTIQGRGGSLEVQRRTARCTMAANTVCERHISVVDTPGWWMNYYVDESPIFDQREILRSLSLCFHGPHALLLVIRVDRAFTETYRRAVVGHLELLGETVWTHTMVLFSFGDWLGDTPIEQYIESEGEALQWLVEKCDNRYHVLDNKSKVNEFQVSRLMEKIEQMVAGNCGGCYEMEDNVLQKLQERIKTDEEKGRERLARKQAQRDVTRSLLDKLNSLSSVRVVLLGNKNTGKSSTGNTILGRKLFDIGSQTTGCAEGHSTVRGSTVTVLDTPGRLPADPYLLMPPSAHTALLLLVNASSSFPLSLWEATQKHMENFGEKGWNRAIVLFTFGDWLGDTSIEQRIESEGESLQRLIERCGNRYHVLDNKNWGGGAQVRELLELIDEMLMGERLEMLHRGFQRWKDIPVVPELQVAVLPGALGGPTTSGLTSLSGMASVHQELRVRERTLKRLVESGGLQALIDQWGDSNIEELESFIDSYFEMVWKGTMESVMVEPHDFPANDTPEQDEGEEHAREVLSSIDKKLSKLEILEELQRDIVDLKQTGLHSDQDDPHS